MINRVGYTQDGLVFLVMEGQMEGKPMQTITQMPPAQARQVAEHIREAAEAAEKAAGGGLNERNGGNSH